MSELLSSTAVPVIWRRHSFGDPIRELRPAGQSLAEIVRSLPELPPRFWEDGIIMVGDQPVPRHMWARVRPKPKADGSIDVALWLAPQNGLLRIVATIALIAAVSLVSGGALAPVFGGLFAAGTVGAAVAAAGVGILGSLAINALSPPPSTGAIDPGGQGISNEKTASSLQGNLLRPGAPIAHVRGTRKIFPPIVVKPFVDLQGDDEVITAVLGLAGHHSIADVSADRTPLDDLEEVTYETRAGANNDTLITLVDFQSKTDGNQIELSQHDIDPAITDRLADQVTLDNAIPHWHAMRALGAPDEIRINLRWPQGLFDQDNPDTQVIVPIRTRLRQVGTSTWTNLPEVFFSFGRQKTFQKDIRIIFEVAGAAPVSPTVDAPTHAHIAVPMRVEGVIGDATDAADAFDGALDTSASWGVNTNGYIGGDFHHLIPAPRTIAYAVLEPADVDLYGGVIDATFNLRAKNGSAPASRSDGTLLATTGNINNPDVAGNILLTSNDTSTEWRYIWIEWQAGGGGNTRIGNVRFIGDNDHSWLADDYFWGSITGPWHMDAVNAFVTTVRRISLYPDSARVYLDPGGFPKGNYEIEIKRGAVNAEFDHGAYNAISSDGIPHPDHFLYGNVGGVWVVPRDYAGVYDKIVRQRFQLKWYEHPLPDAPGNLALIAVMAVNRQIGQVSCIAGRYVRDWDGSGWNTLTTTSNPAPHARDILIGALNARPVPDELIDDDNFVAWRTHNISNGYQVNAVIEGQAAAVAAQLCAACGYARMRQSETFGVIIDKDRSLESPVQTFTARNARNYQWEKQLIEFPSGFRAIFADITNDYEDTELIVLDPEGDQGARYEEVRYDGFVTEAEVEARALFDMKQARLRMTFHSFEAGQQAIKCKRGDLIGINHPVLTEQMGAAYIREILTDGAGNVTGLRLDGSVPTSGTDGFFSGPDEFIDDLYGDGLWGPVDIGIVVRLEDGNELTAQIDTNGAGNELDSRTLILASPEPVPSGLAEGCLVATGTLGSERLRLIVGEIAPKAGDQFPQQITAVDEAPAIWE